MRQAQPRRFRQAIPQTQASKRRRQSTSMIVPGELSLAFTHLNMGSRSAGELRHEGTSKPLSTVSRTPRRARSVPLSLPMPLPVYRANTRNTMGTQAADLTGTP